MKYENCKHCAYCEYHDEDGYHGYYCGGRGYLEDQDKLENIIECDWAEEVN